MIEVMFCRHAQQARLWVRSMLLAVLVCASVVPGGNGTVWASSAVTISGIPAGSVNAGSSYAFTPTAVSPLGRKLSFAIANKPAWASFSSSTGTLSGNPTAANIGRFPNVLIAVNDGLTSAMLKDFAIYVVASSGGGTPTVTISGTPGSSVTTGSSYSFQPTARDSAGRTLSFSVKNKPIWSNFSISSGLLSGTPSSNQTGTYANIVISASDGKASSALAPFSVTVSKPTSSGSATLSWVEPTKNTNGTPLTNLAGTRIYYGTNSGSLTHVVQVAGSGQTSYTVGGLNAGTWYFGTTAYNTAGVESSMSPLGRKSIP